MMAAFLVPICALAGSAVDMARLYVVKVRLQQACDAGVLAGRKFMVSSNDTTLDTAAATQAKIFFANNFTSGWMGTPDFTSTTSPYPFVPTKTSDQQVAGTATTTVPMTVMKMFGNPDETITVTCEARFDVADSDIMFVLDTTGSMSCVPSAAASCTGSAANYTKPDGTKVYYRTEAADSKLDALRDAVVDFDTTMRSFADPTTHIRYGFVTYSSSVNVGKLIPVANMVSGNYSYQTRVLNGEANSGGNYDYTVPGITSSANCTAANKRYPGPDATLREGWYSNSTAYVVSGTSWSSSASLCKGKRQDKIPSWRYKKSAWPVGQFISDASGVVDPTRLDGRISKWQGCIEERDTTAGATTFDIDNLPGDLDPDLIPDSDATRWRPLWPDVTWYRSNTTSEDSTEADSVRENSNDGFVYNMKQAGENHIFTCGVPSQRLAVMSASQVSNYVNQTDFRANGSTYHDVGMIWGARLLSPNGVFAADTAAWPGRNEPTRHIVFMTDGAMQPITQTYGQYGIEDFDRRITGTTATSTATAKHNARFLAVCDYAKNRLNITVWVVALGTALSNDLKSCATTKTQHAFFATNKTELQNAFKKIAQQVAALRISK